jgi:hypothetical protein
MIIKRLALWVGCIENFYKLINQRTLVLYVHCQLNLFESVRRNSFPQIVETGTAS